MLKFVFERQPNFLIFSENKFTAKTRSLCLKKNVCHTESLCLSIKSLVTVFNKKNVRHTKSLCLRKNIKKRSKTVKNGQKNPFLTIFDSF